MKTSTVSQRGASRIANGSTATCRSPRVPACRDVSARRQRDRDEQHADQRRHREVRREPAEVLGQVERDHGRRDHAEAVAPLRGGRAGALLVVVEQLDAVRVDHDVLARRQ
jgi:hypothetical protein